MIPEAKLKEHRRWPRYQVKIRASLKLTRNGIEHFLNGTCYDISEGGTRLFVASELHPGEELHLKLAVPYGQPVMVLAVVRNNVRYEYGVEFTEVNEQDRQSIVRNCKALSLLV